jgi:hypothetical protein
MSTPSAPVDATRLRVHPVDRAIGGSQILNLATELAQLRSELHPAVQGHRQITIFHQHPITMVLFDFEQDGVIPEHTAPGVVTIQVLEGTLCVQVGNVEHALDANQIMVLSVRATLPGAMLLTVQLVGEKATAREA